MLLELCARFVEIGIPSFEGGTLIGIIPVQPEIQNGGKIKTERVGTVLVDTLMVDGGAWFRATNQQEPVGRSGVRTSATGPPVIFTRLIRPTNGDATSKIPRWKIL